MKINFTDYLVKVLCFLDILDAKGICIFKKSFSEPFLIYRSFPMKNISLISYSVEIVNLFIIDIFVMVNIDSPYLHSRWYKTYELML